MKSFLTAPRLLQDTDGNQVRADQIAGPNAKLLHARDHDEEPAAPPPKAKIPCPVDGCCESFANAGNLDNHNILKHPVRAHLCVILIVCLSVRLPVLVYVLVCMRLSASPSHPLSACRNLLVALILLALKK